MSSSLSSGRVGSQEPSFTLCAPWTETEGWLAAALAEGYGLKADPWQETILADWLARSEDGSFANITCGLMVPRRNGKNALLEMRELYGLLILGERIFHTAHEYQAAKMAFDRLASYFGRYPGDPEAPYPELNMNLRTFTRSAGQMIIELRNGARAEFRTRTTSAGRGEGYDLLVIDEAQEYTEEQSTAISFVNDAPPTGHAQTIYTGTPPDPGSRATVFTGLHRQAHEEAPSRECWHEWGVDEVGDITDRDRWYETNPSLGIRLREEYIESKMATMSPQAFARERLGFWPDAAKANPISAALWKAREVPSGPGEGSFAYGVKFSPGGDSVAIVGARKPDEGPVFIELIQTLSGDKTMETLFGYLMDRKDKATRVVIDGISGAPTLEAQLLKNRFPAKALVRPGGKQVIEATSRFYEAVRSGNMSHSPQEPLKASALGCIRRPVGRDGAWAFGSTEECDSTPIEAAALAFWGAHTAKRDPNRKGRVGC